MLFFAKEFNGRGLQLHFQQFGCERILRQSWAVAHHAIQNKVNAWLVEWTDDLVLIVVQRSLFAANDDFVKFEKRCSVKGIKVFILAYALFNLIE